MSRFDFSGINSNEAACVLLYVIAVVWVLNISARRIAAKSVLIIAEAVLVILVAATMSRGAVVALIGGLACVRYLLGKQELIAEARKGENAEKTVSIPKLFRALALPRFRDGSVSHWRMVLNWFSYSLLWRLLLLLSSPGLWTRSSPAYVAQDASIGNRLALWKGAVKLIAAAPLGGWGYTRTGASYMNWFQGVDDHTYYNGVVNSYLQIGAGWGLPVLFAGLAVAGVALFQAHGRVACATQSHGRDARATQTGGFAVHGRVARATRTHGLEARATLLCFFWILIWMIMSCFSSMLASPLLFIPPLAAIIVALFLHPPVKTDLIGPMMISFSLCFLIFSLGHRLAGNDSLSITRNSDGLVTVANDEIKTGKTCVIFIDEGALGEEFGKEVRKFMLGADFESCVVVDKASHLNIPHANIGHVDLTILSGITVDQVEIREGRTKYILLNPAYLPRYAPSESVQVIVYPEINLRHHLAPETSGMDKFQSKIRMVPFNENFETSWAEYTN